MSDQEKFTPQTETSHTTEKDTSLLKEDYIKSALENLQSTSRTAEGVIDTTASADKVQQMQEGLSEQEIANRAVENFKKTIEYLHDERGHQFKNPGELRSFVENIAQRINEGITKPNILIRSGADSTQFPYTKIKDLEQAMERFYEELLKKLHDERQDPKEIAAFIEFHIDPIDHFFADGCGKAAKAASAWLLMRENILLPQYRSRDEYYAAARLKDPSGDPKADSARQWEQWLAYYKTLFKDDKK